MQEFLTSFSNLLGLAWWVEVTTENPRCTYYFGPFLNAQEAADAEGGYIEDLEKEGALGIQVDIKRCKPDQLTVFDDLGEAASQRVSGALSSQFQ
jgi:hypothetical protein